MELRKLHRKGEREKERVVEVRGGT